MIESVIRRFPDLNEKIERLYNEAEDFRYLCEDYHLCAETLEHWQSSVERNQSLIVEYRELLKDLEQEIMCFLSSYRQT